MQCRHGCTYSCVRTEDRRPCSPLLSPVHILVPTAAPPIADTHSSVHSCLDTCSLCSCRMVWSDTDVVADDGTGTTPSHRLCKADPRVVSDEYCHTAWRVSVNSVKCELCIREAGISTRSLRCDRLVPSPFSTVALTVRATLTHTAHVVNLSIVRITQVYNILH